MTRICGQQKWPIFADFQAVAVPPWRLLAQIGGGSPCNEWTIGRCAHCLRPRLHARPAAVDRPDVLALRFHLIRQLSKLGPAPDRALDSSPSGLTHTLGRPTTALNPAACYPFDARTQRASSLLAPNFRRNCDISIYFSVVGPNQICLK